MELTNAGLVRERDYWRAEAEKAQVATQMANQQATNREVELRNFELANHSQQQFINMVNICILEMEIELLRERQKVATQLERLEDRQRRYDEKIVELEETI